MGSTRQIFSEDRHTDTHSGSPGPGGLVPTNTKIRLIIKFFWSDWIETNRKYLDNREIFETASSESIKNIGKSQYQMKPWMICVLFFLQLFLTSQQQNLSVVVFKTNTFFFHPLKSWNQFWSLTLFSRNQSINSYNSV